MAWCCHSGLGHIAEGTLPLPCLLVPEVNELCLLTLKMALQLMSDMVLMITADSMDLSRKVPAQCWHLHDLLLLLLAQALGL